MKNGPVLWPKVVQQLTGPAQWLKNVVSCWIRSGGSSLPVFKKNPPPRGSVRVRSTV